SLENVIGDPSRLILTRSQLQEHAIWCYFEANDNPNLFGGKRSGWDLLSQRKMTSEQLSLGLGLHQMTSEQLGSGLRLHQITSKQLGSALHEMTTATNIAGLIPKPPSSAPFVPPIRNEWETLIQPLFDEYSRTQPNFDARVSEVAAPVPAVSTSIEEDDHDIEVAHMNDNSRNKNTIPEPSSEESSSRNKNTIPEPSSEESSSQNVNSINQPLKHIFKWTKDHPIENVIGNPSRSVSTRHQLQDEAMFCYFDAFLSFVEPKTYKEALEESCWIEAMQEELHEFEPLEVWELIPRPERVMIITLKWILKVKLDELGGVLKNKARLVARGYRQEEGIDFKESFALVTNRTSHLPRACLMLALAGFPSSL
ncbi:retrovirus-related pol polyprotein from transposon TNT 1-94, partial [Tanacetum coccineum]